MNTNHEMPDEAYGAFINDGRCYELRQMPPRKWQNVHYGEFGDTRFVGGVFSSGDGFTYRFMEDGEQVSLSGHETKCLYIRDNETNLTFSPFESPVPTPVDEKWIRYEAASTLFYSACAGIEVFQRFFVPRTEPTEIWTVTVNNKSDRKRSVSVYAYVHFCFPGSHTIAIHPEIGGVFAERYWTERPDNPQKGFLIALDHFHAATGRRDDFLRHDLSKSTPRITDGWELHNKPAHGYHARGIVEARLSLEPGESGRIDFLLGHAMSVDEVAALRKRLSPERIDELYLEQEQIEQKRAAQFQVRIGNSNLEALMNHFVKKQLYSYLMNKSGFRDNLQVTHALAMADYPTACDALLKALSSQHQEGWAPHSYRPLKLKRCSDKPAWILQVVPALIKESGDFSVLERELPYLDGSKGSVWDHVLRAMRWLANDTGKNGLCDLWHGDWNDGLSIESPPKSRESIMVTEQFCHGLLEVAELAGRIGDENVQQEAQSLHKEFARRLNEVAWDGEWYQRVLCDDGFIIGSKNSPEGQIYMNAQSWAILGGVAPPERATLCMDSVERHLKLDIGYRVCNPPFSRYDARVGQNSTVYPGETENGGCYNHAAGFKLVADCMLGRAEEAWTTFRKVAPGNPENPLRQSMAEPFAFVNKYWASPDCYGESLYAWNTGTAAWMTIGLIEYILGARRDYDGLRIDPCLTRTIPNAYVKRTFRGAVFEIYLDNTAGRQTGAQSIKLDGKEVEGNQLPDLREGTHRVDVVI